MLCISNNPINIKTKGAFSIKFPCALMDWSNSAESPYPNIVLVFPLVDPDLKARKTARIVSKDAYKRVISIVINN